MADFSALKTSIQNYIKQNGNEDITGNLLQQVLLSMVTTLGDSAINNLVTALNNEVTARGNADGTLQGNINTLQGVVNGIKTNVENGYVYAGIATPSTTPVSGKVFYLALQAGTYTNFGNTVVSQGINILKYNGSAWSLDSFLGLDDAPTQGSNNLVKSGGVLDSIIKDGSAFDLSAYNSGTTYADLSAALTALNALPAAYKKGGMSMKFVQSSDNKYIQYRLMSDTFNATPTNWQGVDNEPTAGSNNLVKSGGVHSFISAGYIYKGVITPSSIIPTPTQKVCYLAGPGYYTIGNNSWTIVNQNIAVFYYNPTSNTWTADAIKVSAADILNLNNYENTANIYPNVWAARNAISSIYRHPGMLITYKLASGWAIDQYIGNDVETATWTNSSSWVTIITGVDTFPTFASDNLVRSGGTFNYITDLGILDVSILNKSGSTPASYTDLGALFAASPTQIPSKYRRGGMTIKFINSSTGEYEQYRYRGTSIADQYFLSIYNWQGIDKKPKNNSHSLVESNGVYNSTIIFEDLSVNEPYSSRAIKADGSITEEGATYSSGKIYVIPISKNKIYRMTFKSVGFTNSYIIGGTYKDGNLKKSFGRCDNTVHDCDIIVNNSQGTCDTIKLSVYTNATPKVLIGTSNIFNNDEKFDNLSDIVVLPDLVYDMTFSLSGFNVLSRLYVEGILKTVPDGISHLSDIGLKINDNQSVFLHNSSYNSEGTYNKNITITANGYSELKTQIPIKATSPSRLKNNRPFILQIGDSLTDGGYPALTEFIFKCFNSDLGNISALMVGTKIDNLTFKLGSYEFTCKGASEGRSGLAISDYLRHFCCVRRQPGTNSRDMITGKAAWDSLGLGTLTRNGVPERDSYMNFSNSQTQGNWMRTTCHGYYDADPSEELWTWLTTKRGLSTFVYNGVTYTFSNNYTIADNATQIAAVKYCCEHPSDGGIFYDKETVENSNGVYAFNLEKYLAKYKTLANDGSTRLIVGDTAGTEITSDTVNVYDVCKPTHVVIVMNENDVANYDNGVVVAQDLILAANLISSYDNTIKIAIGSTRGYGAINPDSYEWLGFMNNFEFVKRRLDTYVKLKELISQTNYAHIPIYAIQTPNGSANGKGFDTLDYMEKVAFCGDTLHAGDKSLYLDRAYQTVAWIASTYNT